jgi:O-6-methylguanine DNA methyltransferase
MFRLVQVSAKAMKRIDRTQVWELPIPTRDGKFIARYSDKGLCELNFPSDEPPPRKKARAEHLPEQIRRWHVVATEALETALKGEAPKELPPFDLSSGTEFQRRVWTAMQKVGAGHTCSYSELARASGKADAVRAVGGACGANPIPVFVPCHRILAANRRLGGFSAGLEWKRKLLAREGMDLPLVLKA